MSQACYDPSAAVGLWARMEAEEQGRAPPQFISTHPSSHNRMEKIQSWLGQAEMKREQSGCGQVSDYGKQSMLDVGADEKRMLMNPSRPVPRYVFFPVVLNGDQNFA